MSKAGSSKPNPSFLPTRGKGINPRAAMQWLYDTLITGTGPLLPPKHPLSNDVHDYGGGSPNMKLLYAIDHYIYYVIAVIGKSRQGMRADLISGLSIARKRLSNLLKRENTICHGHSEPLTASHGQLWLGAMAAGLLAAEKYDNALDGGDGNYIHSSIVEWFQLEYAIYYICRIPESALSVGVDSKLINQPWLPGARAMLKGSLTGANYTRGKLMVVVESNGKAGNSRIIGKLNKYDLAPACLSKVDRSTLGRIPNLDYTPLPLVSMWGAFHAVRYEDGRFYAYFDSLPYLKPHETSIAAGWDGKELWIQSAEKELDMAGIMTRYGILESSIVDRIDLPAARISEKGRLVEDRLVW